MKTVWITGGGSGIGRALALRYVQAGDRVYVSGRDAQKLKDVPGAHPIVCDITDMEQVKRVIAEMGSIDLAILNAGTYEPGAASETDVTQFRKTMEVNYFGTINCLTNLLPTMKRTGGHIGVVASLAGYRGLPNAGGYGPSKAAVISLCESLKTELLDSRVKFQMINPGFVKSSLTAKNEFQMPYLMEAEEAAAEIFKGLQTDRFEIAFPTPFVRRLKILRMLPYKIFFPLIKKATSR